MSLSLRDHPPAFTELSGGVLGLRHGLLHVGCQQLCWLQHSGMWSCRWHLILHLGTSTATSVGASSREWGLSAGVELPSSVISPA